MKNYTNRLNANSLNPTVQEWLNNLYTEAIEEAEQSLSNERLWEKGYDGEEDNPHTENIEAIEQYISVLTQLRADIQPKPAQEQTRKEALHDVMLSNLAELVDENGLVPTLLDLGFTKAALEREGILKKENN